MHYPDTSGTRITGIDIPFGQLVVFLIKLAFAAIPATIIIAVIWSVLGMVLGALFIGSGMLDGMMPGM